LPGGGLAFGETPREALVREFEEETGLLVRPDVLIDVVSDVVEYPVHGVRVHAVRALYRVNLDGGAIRPEIAGSTDAVAWHDLASVISLPLVPFTHTLLRTHGATG
jgi:ADP-ribose pyrophosphatase YjhB (NUDIX family)